MKTRITLSMKRATGILAFLFAVTIASHSQPCSVPDTLFSADTIIVCNDTTTLVNTVPLTGSLVYNWSTGEGGSSAVTITRNGKYWVQVSDGACSKTDTVTVLFNSFVLSPVVEAVTLCKGGAPETIRAQGQNLLWYSGPVGGTGSITPPVQSTADTGRWEYWVSQTIRGCETPRAQVNTRVIDIPYFELGEPFIIPCDASGIVLQVIPEEGTSYLWSTGVTNRSTLVTERGKYSLYAENMCGNFRDTVQAVECKDRCVQFPTGFTPNGDGKNDLFRAAAFCPVPAYRLIVFNRNGEKVFETSNPADGWDGSYRGKKAPIGAYVFYSEYFDFVLKRSLTDKGTVMLIK